jgi:antitoxin (DNA-binding transcriptional repressor) of toxin-antitoxin stability system
MKVVSIKDTKLEACVREAQRQEVVITKKGKPVAVVVSTNGMDLEQLELAYSKKFWKQVEKWRKQKTITREELERRLAEDDKPKK